MLLGLVPECIEVLSKGEHRVLKIGRGTGRSCLRRLLGWWWRWVGRGLANVSLGIAQGSIPSLIVMQLVLVRGLMAGIIGPLRSRDTRCVPLNKYGLYGVEPGLIVVEGHPGSFAQAKDKKVVPQIHLCVPVMEDSILYNLPNIKGYIL